MVKEKTQKAKKEKAPKPKYNMAQNSWFMIKLAWTSGEKKVIVLSLLSAFTAVALNLINLYGFPHDTLCGGKKGISSGTDLDDSGVCRCVDARLGGFLVCQHEHIVRKNQRSPRNHCSAK